MSREHRFKVKSDFYISVDVETAGPYPGQYSLLSIGACTLDVPRRTFYVELKPINEDFTEEAMEICQLSLSDLAQNGLEPKDAMGQFESWLQAVVPDGHRPIFTAFNAAFDWMFVTHYFHRYLGHNPFGYAALDVKSFYMALHGVPWIETSMQYVAPHYLGERSLSHHALQDALDQADIFQGMLDTTQERSSSSPENYKGKNLSERVKEANDE